MSLWECRGRLPAPPPAGPLPARQVGLSAPPCAALGVEESQVWEYRKFAGGGVSPPPSSHPAAVHLVVRAFFLQAALSLFRPCISGPRARAGAIRWATELSSRTAQPWLTRSREPSRWLPGGGCSVQCQLLHPADPSLALARQETALPVTQRPDPVTPEVGHGRAEGYRDRNSLETELHRPRPGGSAGSPCWWDLRVPVHPWALPEAAGPVPVALDWGFPPSMQCGDNIPKCTSPESLPGTLMPTQLRWLVSNQVTQWSSKSKGDITATCKSDLSSARSVWQSLSVTR